MKRSITPSISAVITALVIITLVMIVDYMEDHRYRQELHTRVISQLSQVRARLEAGINDNFYLTRGLIAYVETAPDLEQDTFHHISENLLRHHNYIRNIGLAPDNILSFIHPLQGNEKALGLDYTTNKEQWPAVKRAIDQGRTVVAGPVNLVQGGQAFISRTPVYINSDNIPPYYWGLASIVIDQQQLFQDAGFYDDSTNIKIAIRGLDGKGEDGAIFDGDSQVFESNPVLLHVNLPAGNWQLAAIPRNGWFQQSPFRIWIRAVGSALALLLGTVIYFWLRSLILMQNTIENARKNAEDATTAMRKNEQFLHAIFENIPDMIFVKDAHDLRFISFNKAGEELTGYQREELIGKNDYDFFPAEQADFFTGKDQEVINGRELLDIPEEEIETKHKGTRLLHTKKLPILNDKNKPLYLLGISEDITEQKLAYEQIRKDAERTKILLDLHKNAPHLNGRKLYAFALEKAVSITESSVGYIHEVEEIEGVSTIILTEWNQTALQHCTATYDTHYPLTKAGIWADSIRRKEPVINNNYQNDIRKKGYPEGHFNINRHLGVPVIDDDKVRLVIGVGNKESDYTNDDILQVQLIANELQKLIVNKRVVAEQEKLAEQLKQAQKMEAIGLLAGGVAHDLNNILSGIIGYPELLLSEIPKDSTLRQPITDIRESGKRAAAVVADLLTVARNAANTREIHDLNALSREYLSSPEFRQLDSIYQNISCHSELKASPAIISCSPVHVKKCIMNLITNGYEAIKDGGMLTIATENLTIDTDDSIEYGLTSGPYVVLSVRDNGPGIPDADLDHVFEPFYTRKVMGRSGSGLGLTVVWNTMKEHSGKVTLESSDAGTCFRLYFPLSRESIHTCPARPEEEPRTEANEHILVVDDEPQLRDLASKMLSSLGYRVDSVCSGELAVKFVKENPVDLIVLDMLMEPGMNGYRTYQEVLKFNPEQKAIIASGFSESDDVKKTIRLGAGGFIKKPYSIQDLGQAVKKVLQV